MDSRLFVSLTLTGIAIHLPQVVAKKDGKLIGDFASTSHGVSGTVYAGTDSIFWIEKLNYDGQGRGLFSTLTRRTNK